MRVRAQRAARRLRCLRPALPIAFLFVLSAPLVPAAPANVLLILPDDLSYNDFDFYNHRPDAPRTPNFDRLASESVVLSDFHVSPSCSPSRASIMTGRYNDACGVWHTILGRYFLRPDEITMADVFKANGYRTALFGKWHLGDSYPFRPQDRGFDYTAMIHGGGIDQQPDYWGNHNTAPCTLFVNDRPVALTADNSGIPGAFSTNFFTTQAIDYMKTCQGRQQPFFAYLAYNVAHSPSDRPPDARPGIDAHTATIENMDKNLGRILEFLDDSRLSDNTVLLFFTDNGEASSLFRGDKTSEYEGGHRVPCFIRWKAGGCGGTPNSAREMPRLVSHIDLLPTLMDLLGLHDVSNRSPLVPIQGESFKSLLDVGTTSKSIFAARTLVVDNQRLDTLTKYKQACVMRDALDVDGRVLHKWRLLRESSSQPWELYDVQTDFGQRIDLVDRPENKPIVEALQSAYETWWSTVSSRASEYSRPVLGSSSEPTVCLYAHDWHTEDAVPYNQALVASGMKANGFNAVEFARPGDYIFDLRRWPREIAGETTIDSKLHVPLKETEPTISTEGKALPIHSARIRIWNGNQVYADERQKVDAHSSGPVFVVHSLPAGPAMVQTWFYDASGHELCGAYYDYVHFSGSQ